MVQSEGSDQGKDGFFHAELNSSTLQESPSVRAVHICANLWLSGAERRKRTLWPPLVRIPSINFSSSPRKCVKT